MSLPFRRILLVDDNEDDNLYHRIMLEEAQVCAGGNIDEVYNGLEALDYLQCTGNFAYRKDMSNKRPELILLDLQMPGMDGWTFLEEYKKLHPKIKGDMIVVLLTNSKDNVDVNDDEGKTYEYMSKPLSKKKIEQIVAQYKEKAKLKE